MSSRDETILVGAVAGLGPKPEDSAKQADKKRYSERLSESLAMAFAAMLRERNLIGTRPCEAGQRSGSGAERRMAGGIGAKKVDVTWATEESGLMLAISIKTINFRDSKTKNFQKNLINRRGDMLMEAVTLHRRFPYAVLAGMFFLDIDATRDYTARRESTFSNAHVRLKLFTGRADPSARDEQFEKLYLVTFDPGNSQPFNFYEVGEATKAITVSEIIDTLLNLIVLRNSDLYEIKNGKLYGFRG